MLFTAPLFELAFMIVPGFPIGLTPDLLPNDPWLGSVLLLCGAPFSTTGGFWAIENNPFNATKLIINNFFIMAFFKNMSLLSRVNQFTCRPTRHYKLTIALVVLVV